MDQKIDDIPEPDLSPYSTKTEVDEKIAAIPKPDMSEYYKKTETYSKTEVETLIDERLGLIENGSY